MIRLSHLMLMWGVLISLHVGDALAAGNAESGKSLFQSHCMACHSLTANRVGPMLSGVYGRKAGSAPDFNYSTAVKSSGITWNEATLDQWLSSPQKLIPGQKMNISISDPQKRADIIAYLKTLSDKP